MKNFIRKASLSYFVLLIIATSAFLTGCKPGDDPEVTGAVPSVTLSASSATNTQGNMVSTSLAITAPEGLKSLVIYKNGITENTIAFNNEKTATYSFEYTIENTITTGSVINFTFMAVDSRDRQSEVKTFAITVAAITAKEIVNVTGNISGNVTWTADKIWRLQGFVRIQNGAVLTIEPGTVIFGEKASKGTLIAQQGGKLIADGTAQHPIVFTSESEPGSRLPGDWGGVVLCGKAANNQGTEIELEGGYGGIHGGNIADDNSGILRYVRIEFAGIAIQSNQETNSLTMGSVGSGTIIEHVQCSFGLDDAFEWFGGTVNGKYLVSYQGMDDDFDVDFGHSGFIQFGLAIRGATLADQSGSNGFEVDNDGFGSNQTPLTQSVFANMTIIGPKQASGTIVQPQFQHAAQLRRNSSLTIYNSFMTGYPVGLFIDDTKPGSSRHALDGDLQIRNLILAGVDGWGNNNWGGSTTNTNGPLKEIAANVAPGFEINAWFNTTAFKNQLLPKWQDAGIDNGIFNSGSPVVLPVAGSMLLTAAEWTNTPKAGSFFQQVPYAGAFGTEDWTAGWCEWNPNAVDYRY